MFNTAYERTQEWRERPGNRDRMNEKENQRRRAKYQNDPVYREAVKARSRINSPRTNLRKKGISPEQKMAMLVAQGGVCKVCGSDVPGSKRGWHADHIHGTKIVRGILCHHCNVSIGFAKDNPGTLRAMADYVEHPHA